MSQGVEIFNLARRTYLRLLPSLRPAAAIFLTTSVGAALMGPVGAIPGAAVGVVGSQWPSMLLEAFMAILQFIEGNSVGLVLALITQLTQLLGQGNQPLEN